MLYAHVNKKILSQSEYGIIVYYCLKIICYLLREIYPDQIIHTTAHQILDIVSPDHLAKQDKFIMQGLNELQDNRYISYSVEGNNLTIDCSQIYNDCENEFYISLYLSDIRKIFEYDTSASFKITKYYAILLGTFNPAYRVGNMSIEYISSISGISVRSIKRYNTLLCQDILYIKNSEFKKNNYYCRLEDRDGIEKYIEEKEMGLI